jgi:hypothetical protein
MAIIDRRILAISGNILEADSNSRSGMPAIIATQLTNRAVQRKILS